MEAHLSNEELIHKDGPDKNSDLHLDCSSTISNAVGIAHPDVPNTSESHTSESVNGINHVSNSALSETPKDGTVDVVNEECTGEETSSLHADEQEISLASLADMVKTLAVANDELRQAMANGVHKIADLETHCSKLEQRNRELEIEVARLSSATKQSAGDVARLTANISQIISKQGQRATTTTPDSETQQTNSSASQQKSSDKSPSPGKSPVSSLPAQPTIEDRVMEFEQKLEHSTMRFSEFAATLEHIEKDLQRYIRRLSLVVEHLCPKEDRSAADAFLIFVNGVLGVNADDSDIDSLHLVDKPVATAEGSTSSKTNSPTKPGEIRPRPVLITFTCFKTRTRVYKAWLSYRVGASGDGKVAAGSLSGERGQGVCIREYLTASQEAIYQHAVDIRHRRPDVITDCWTYRGRTYVRTALGEVKEFSETADWVPKDDSKGGSCLVM